MGGWPVKERILGRLPVTVELGVLAIVIGLVIALPVGIYSAVRQYTAADYVGRSVAIMGLATPNFWLGTMVMIYPAIWWAWSPPIVLVPLAQDPLGNLGMFIIPSLILGTYLSASTMRMTRTMMLEVLRQDYIRTAWAKGLLERSVILRHAVKNAIIPVVTLVGMQLPILVGGAVIIENIFNLPGLGRLRLGRLERGGSSRGWSVSSRWGPPAASSSWCWSASSPIRWRPTATRRSTCATACRLPRPRTCWAPTTSGATS